MQFNWDAATIRTEARKRGLSNLQARTLEYCHANGEHTARWGELDGEQQKICMTKLTVSKRRLSQHLHSSSSGAYEALCALKSRGILMTKSSPAGTVIVVLWNRLRAVQAFEDIAESEAIDGRRSEVTHSGDRPTPTTADYDRQTQEKSAPVDLDGFPGFPDGIWSRSLPDVRLYTVLRNWWHEWHLAEHYDANQITGAILATRHRDRDAPEQYCRAVLRNGVTTRWCTAAEKWRARQANELARTNGHRMTGRGG